MSNVTGPDGIKDVRQGQIVIDENERVYLDNAFGEACIHMAGMCANKRMDPKMTYAALTLMVGATEVHNVAKLLDYLCFGDTIEKAKMERTVLTETRKLVGLHWDSIIKVGDELLVRKRLSYDEVKARS